MMIGDHLPSIADNKPGTFEYYWWPFFMKPPCWLHRSNSNDTAANSSLWCLAIRMTAQSPEESSQAISADKNLTDNFIRTLLSFIRAALFKEPLCVERHDERSDKVISN